MKNNNSNKEVSVEVRGIKFRLMAYTRSLELCARMNYETENLDFIDEMKSGDVFYDLGACEGRFSIYAALKGLTVYAFEPESRNFKVLNENLALNSLGLDSVRTFNVAVGEDTYNGFMKIGQPWEGGHQKVVEHSSIREDLNFNFIEEQSISIISLDKFIANNRLPHPNYLKIDIDGSEVPFLKGFSSIIDSPSIRGLIFELDKADKNYYQIIKTLDDSGFSPEKEFQVPNEPTLYNIIFGRKL